MAQHEFSPIDSPERFQAALDYIATQAQLLGESILKQTLPIDTLTIFAHTDKEDQLLDSLIRKHGRVSDLSHGLTLYVEPNELVIQGHRIKYLGMRAPDSTKPQIGYADFPVDNFDEFAELSKTNPRLELITSGRGQSLVELRQREFDVLGYIVNAQEH